ncbi:hypothetical protein [Frigoribacterium sp. CG_9.8]|uniref:hypothetical protein n=1 Tax=Frigoribacterium sp. CG_9.8 TaxID=2787733 RepID=UPI0018C98DBF|nr:hypothetical protein [Frigoribacterium sp. CG_9.8]MBG6106552.1 hypothetical protein [Frigoribacterium sp. CG_9.8]
MANPGVTPLEATSPIAQVRLLLGDDSSVPLSPIVVGQGDYKYFADVAISISLQLANGNVTRACSVLIKQLALSLTIAGQSIGADGFTINTLGKGRDLLQVAESYAKQADAEDARAARDEALYAIVNTRLRSHEPTLDLSDLFGR